VTRKSMSCHFLELMYVVFWHTVIIGWPVMFLVVQFCFLPAK